jgi:uncharacterized protein
MLISRTIQEHIEGRLFSGKALVIYGARQVGKTTLVKQILQGYSGRSLYLNADLPEVRDALSNKNTLELKGYLGNVRLVAIDEAQRIENIGLTIKILVDTYPEIQLIATGSSSFELANKINEPLTGRAYEFTLYPLSFLELKAAYPETPQAIVNRILRIGSYPGVWSEGDNEAACTLAKLADGYLYKDILEFEQLKKAPLLTQLLRALALQLGSEVSYSELANLLNTNVRTIERYIFLLEQVFIIYRLPALKRNPRREIGKLRKIYFYDLGLRNALIQNHNPTDIRQDAGALWENFCIIERLRHKAYQQSASNYYFWRSASGSEVDLVEERNGSFNAFEFKWGSKISQMPKGFSSLYPSSRFHLINPSNFQSALLD